MVEPFRPPVYPYEALEPARRKAEAHDGGAVDLSVGTPRDPPPAAAVAALSSSGDPAGYPPSVGSPRYRESASAWMGRRFGVDVPATSIAACVGTKELVSGLPHWLRLRDPSRDTVLYPSVSYPTYEMGALLAGCRAVPVPVGEDMRMDLAAVSDEDAGRALALWVNSPGNPAGQLEDLGALAAWGREHAVTVLSDECYAELTWKGPPRTILEHGLHGVVAVHSISKRSNLAGLRAGFYAGDPSLVSYLSEVRKHAGLMVAGPVQAAVGIALDDDDHARIQRVRYRERLELFVDVARRYGLAVELPGGGLYLWARVPGSEPQRSWTFVERMAVEGGALVSPGDLYGDRGRGFVRIAMVEPLERLQLVARRLGSGDLPGRRR